MRRTKHSDLSGPTVQSLYCDTEQQKGHLAVQPGVLSLHSLLAANNRILIGQKMLLTGCDMVMT